MATAEECEKAFHELAVRLAEADAEHRSKAAFDRTLTCTLRDLNVIFAGRLNGGELRDIRRVTNPDAQVRMSMNSGDLIKLVAGELNLGAAWATGRVRINASVLDLVRLRTMF
jgi:alkyl sulfatase BDS1-like metallo-beta-lactamase superfamily hydrolase